VIQRSYNTPSHLTEEAVAKSPPLMAVYFVTAANGLKTADQTVFLWCKKIKFVRINSSQQKVFTFLDI